MGFAAAENRFPLSGSCSARFNPSYDRIAVAAMRAAAIMAGELSDWRFVLERRRARARRPALGGRRR
jgi:hypothetical protein